MIIEDSDKLPGLIQKYKDENGTVIGLMQDVHEAYGYLPEEVLQQVSDQIEVPLSTLYSLATFYASFRLEPMGKHHIKSCVGTACHVKGAPFVVETIERELGIKAGETTPDKLFTFDTVNCLGACALAPLIVIDDEYHGKLDQSKIKKILDDLRKESETE